MISRLPPWVEFGGFALTVTAGSVNAIGLLGFKHQAVSHLTGTSTLLGLELGRTNWVASLHLSLVLLSFLAGAAVSGYIVQNDVLKLGRRYGIALSLESVLLILAMLSLNHGSHLGHYLASAACGLQNAMASTYSGAVVRTTHVSGMFTDLGVMLGVRCRGMTVDRRRVVLYLLLISGFILGGVWGSILFARYHFNALVGPSGITAALAIVYWMYYFFSEKKAA